MSCGCNHVHERHKPGDIVLEDLQQAATNHGLSVAQVADNIAHSAQSETAGSGQHGSGLAGAAARGAGSSGGTRGTAAEGEPISPDETPNM